VSEVVRDFRPGEDDAAVAELWRRCFGDATGGQTSDWLFRSGAAGDCPRTVIEADGRVVAHAGVTALPFRIGDERVRGAYSVAAMTHPDLRGRGLFLRSAKALYARLEREGFAFVAGFSNAQSHRIMTGPLERTPLRSFPWCVRILRPLGIARSLLFGAGKEPPQTACEDAGTSGAADLHVSPCSFDDPRLDSLWRRCEAEVRVACVRDRAFAESRFATRPEAGYRAWIAERDSQPAAWAVSRELVLRGLSATFLVDLLVAPGEARAGRELLRMLERRARAGGVQLLSALLPGSGEARQTLRDAGYRRVPERLHPQVIRFSVRGFGRFRDCPDLRNPSAWGLSWADTDIV
jgi:GNAT superfamily N-acetyltransferase